MSGKKTKGKFYDCANIIKACPIAQYYMVFGERSNGKTFNRLKKAVEMYLLTGKRTAYIRRWKEGKCYEQPLYGMYFPGPGEYDLTGDNVPDLCLYNTSKAPTTKAPVAIQIQEIEIAGKYVKYSDGIVLSDGDKGFVDKHRLTNRVFDEDRDYLYPLPFGDIMLNTNLKQNPKWPTGIVVEEDSDEAEGETL